MASPSMLATRYAVGLLQSDRYREALRWGDLTVTLAEQAHDALALRTHTTLSWRLLFGPAREAACHAVSALRRYEQSDDLTGQGHCLNNLAVQAISEGRWDNGLTVFQRAAKIFAQVGDEATLAAAVYNRADVLIRQGKVDGAEPLLRTLGAGKRHGRRQWSGERQRAVAVVVVVGERHRTAGALDDTDDPAVEDNDELGASRRRTSLSASSNESVPRSTRLIVRRSARSTARTHPNWAPVRTPASGSLTKRRGTWACSAS
ncbi:MAG: tetratricopeptide repeat protein [Actinomycetia bacterium]|nr:tetratricopeptide repeat protein [Actinomycetes bacterium]